MDRRDISMLYIKDQQVETVKQTEKDDENMTEIQSPFIRWMKVCMIRIANSLNLNSLNLEWSRIMDWFTKRSR